jgi:cation transport ATPase
VDETAQTPSRPWHRKTTVIAALSVAAILAHLALRFVFRATPITSQVPLLVTLVIGGVPLLYDLLRKLLRREFGSDLLGGISIVTSVLLGEVSEPSAQGLRGMVAGPQVQVTSRNKLIAHRIAGADQLPPLAGGLECVVAIDQRYAAALRFRDAPRAESLSFVKHLGPKHQFQRVMIVSGDRESEVRYLAAQVGITDIHAQKSPEEKLAIVRAETAVAKTLYVGDGINDAPAMMAATVGMAIGQNSDVTADAAGVVIMDNSLEKVDEFMHIAAGCGPSRFRARWEAWR